MSHTLTSRAIQKTSSGTAYCRLSNICVEFRRSSGRQCCGGFFTPICPQRRDSGGRSGGMFCPLTLSMAIEGASRDS